MKKWISLFLSMMCVLTMVGCNTQEEVPDDFSFALTWNVYGVSSYDSETGKLVKTTDTTHPDDYVTNYQLTQEDKKYIYDLLVSLDVNSYPGTYNPSSDISKPSITLILTVRMDGMEKTIEAKNISDFVASDDEKAQKFLSVCEEISNRLMETEAWKVLPEYEEFYR